MDSTPGTGCSGNRMLPGGDEEEGHRITSLRRSDPRWSGIVRPEIRLTHRWRKPDSNVSSHSRQFLSELVERCAETKWWARGEFLRAGTVGSNPSPSSRESVANSIWAKTALPMRLPPRLLGVLLPSRPLSAGSPIRRWSLDRGSSATHQRSCGFDPRIVVMAAEPPALPGAAQNKRLKESHELTRLLLGKADMRNLPTAGLTCAEEWRLDELVAPDRIT